MPISAVNLQAHLDTVAKHIIDAAALLGSTSAIQTGQATSLGRTAALNAADQEYGLLDAMEAAVANENAWLTNEASYNAILDLWFPACVAFDKLVGGLKAWLDANSVQVDPHYLDAHNRAAGKGGVYPAAIRVDQAFGPVVANMGQFNATGGTGGSFVAGSAISGYGNAPLQMFNAGGGNIGASTVSVTVTYNKYNAAGTLLTGQTVTVNMPSGTVPGGSVSLGVSGVAVTNITVTSGNNGDQIAVKSTLVRSVAY